jgi:gliding motility-associated-like protein
MVKRWWLLILVISFSTELFGQFTSRLGRFQVDQIRGCAPFTINITNTNLITTGECTPGKPCNMDFLGSNPPTLPTNQFSFTYNTPGTYRLIVFYQFIGSDDITITVDPDIQPDFDVYTCSSSGVSIRITDRNYPRYFVNFGDGSPVVNVPASSNQIAQHSYAGPGNFVIQVRGQKTNGALNCSPKVRPFQAINTLPPPAFARLTAVNESTAELNFSYQTNILYRLEIAVNSTNFQLYQPIVYDVNSFTATNLRLKDNFYCFRLDSYDMCTGSHTYSPVICSQKIGLSIQSGLNKIDWQTSGVGVTTFDINRNQAPYNLNMPNSSNSFSDVLIECKQLYCYQVITNYPNGAKSFSLEECGTSFVRNIPTAPSNISSVVSGSQVSLTWNQDPLFSATEYNIFKSIKQGTFFLEGKATSTQFSDNQYASNNATCYKINYVDKCDNDSPESVEACPIALTYSLSPSNEVTLNWTNYGGWVAGVQTYQIEKFNLNGSRLAIFTSTGNTLIDAQVDNVNQIVTYKVTAVPNQTGVTPSTSNIVEVYKQVNLFFPTAFTPDNKGPKENETFFVGGQFISKIELSVFDRWGSLVFYTDKKEAWDGTLGGQAMPIGTYVWRANVTDVSGTTTQHTGTLVLIRK